MAQSGSDVAARRVPLGNLITRLVTGVALLAVIGPAVHWLSFIDPLPARLTVNFHTAFSVIAAIVFLPLTEPLANLCRRLLPTSPWSTTPASPAISTPTCSIRQPRLWAARCARR